MRLPRWPHRLREFRPGFPAAAAVCLLLSLWGCLAVYLATRHLPGPFRFAGRQGVWFLGGAAVLPVFVGISARLYRRYALVAAGLVYLLLWAVLVLGIRINGMRGWFAWRGLFFQPGEVAKPFFVLALAEVMCRLRARSADPRRFAVVSAAFLAAWALPLALQPDFGALLIYALAFCILYWVYEGGLAYLGVGAVLAAGGALGVIARYGYVRERFAAFLNPEGHALTGGWHLLQFRRSLAAGGLFGRTWHGGSWSEAYLPLTYSDSIFAGTAEMVGFLGILPLIFLIAGLLIYAHHKACRSHSEFRFGVILGMAGLLGGQAFIHLGVNLGMVPPTGITLPLISYGGSSLLATMISVGILESMARGTPPAPAADPDAPPGPAEADAGPEPGLDPS